MNTGLIYIRKLNIMSPLAWLQASQEWRNNIFEVDGPMTATWLKKSAGAVVVVSYCRVAMVLLGMGQWNFATEKKIDGDINILMRGTQRVGHF